MLISQSLCAPGGGGLRDISKMRSHFLLVLISVLSLSITSTSAFVTQCTFLQIRATSGKSFTRQSVSQAPILKASQHFLILSYFHNFYSR